MGYFDLTRKRPIPSIIKKIGLITSENGAAIRDFRQNLGEYGFKIYFIDVRVEGDIAEQSIIAGINWLNQNKPDLDVLVIIRGGGSLESLKAFNSEAVADAIVLSRLPVVTGIGHERDETISDYVSDSSFSTPTAVASFIKQGAESLIDDLVSRSDNLIIATKKVFESWDEEVNENRLALARTFDSVLQRYKFLIINKATQIQMGLERIFNSFRMVERNFTDLFYNQQRIIQTQLHNTETWVQTSRRYLVAKLHSLQTRLAAAEAALIQLNPEAVLKKGYSIVYKANKVVMQSNDVHPDDQIKIKLHKGTITSLVEEVDN
jgi:exodeoxyribonuclease VII large subunit